MSSEAFNRKLWQNQAIRAADKGLAFTLTMAEFIDIVRQPCKFCGEPGNDTQRNLLHLKDYKRGYQAGNCSPICYSCLQWFGFIKAPANLLLERFKQIAVHQGWVTKMSDRPIKIGEAARAAIRKTGWTSV